MRATQDGPRTESRGICLQNSEAALLFHVSTWSLSVMTSGVLIGRALQGDVHWIPTLASALLLLGFSSINSWRAAVEVRGLAGSRSR